MLHLYRQESSEFEHCFNIETSAPLTSEELTRLKRILAHGFIAETVSESSFLNGEGKAVEAGPRMNFATAFYANVSQICNDTLLQKVVRIERSRRIISPSGEILKYDRMIECVYAEPLVSFGPGIKPEQVKVIPLMEQGPDALILPGLAMDEWDRDFYHDYFVKQHGRNPTNVEIEDLNNTNSEHSRHGYFKGRQIHDGVEMQETLLEIVQSTLKANPNNSVIAFMDNSSGIRGYDIWTIAPETPGQPSRFVKKQFRYNIIFTAETHNFPTGVAPFPGAETGTGGRIRDIQATGRGGLVIAGSAGYCVGHLLIPGYNLPWENSKDVYPSNLAPSLEVEIRASDGASDYGNKFGEPVILGFTRSFDQRLPSGERWGWGKKLMFTGGIGQMDDRHTDKGKAEKGLLIVQVGGPAYRIGVGGGAASSMLQGENEEKLDFNAVQRGDAEMEQKMNRVVRACVEMGDDNPIVSIHDQGAGGPANVLKELVEKAGGRIELRKITLGDPTLSVLEIWIAEYQERNGFLIHPDRYAEFEAICHREKVKCEKLGVVTGDGRFTVYDELDGSTPVDLELDKVLGSMPQKTFTDKRINPALKPLEIPTDMKVDEAIELVLKNVAVGSKRFLTNKVDRSVTGLIAQQQCCGPLQLTVADVAVVAQSHFGLTGAATSIGEQPIKMLINPAAGARMAIGEALTNIIWAKLSALEDIKCSANWMWAPKLPGEGVAIYDAVLAMRRLMIELGIAADGGKDSLSMALRDGDETIKSPRELVISAYCTMLDIHKVVTPDIKRPGQSHLLFVDLAYGKCRLGGSIFAQVLKQISNVCPDMENPQSFKRALKIVQELIDQDVVLAGHDISDGGLAVALMEMAFAGNCGFNVHLDEKAGVFQRLFAEELGLVIEYDPINTDQVLSRFRNGGIPATVLGSTTENKNLYFGYNGSIGFHLFMEKARSWWEETSYQIERLQANSKCADDEKKNIFSRRNPMYKASFTPTGPVEVPDAVRDQFPVAILREEGSNGDREMTSAFYMAGFRPWDVNMKDLLDGRVSLDRFRGLVAVGGFSYADYPDSAKGWAAVIRENPRIKQMFDDFYSRSNTFSLGVCNGCQLFALLGWVPWSGIPDKEQPRFILNASGRFESRWSTVRIIPSPAIMFKDMGNSVLGVWVAHGEGRLHIPKKKIYKEMVKKRLVSMVYVNDNGDLTEQYPYNPNGSPHGITGICTPDGRHLAMMPHPERAFLKWQWAYLPEELNKEWPASPWFKMFQNVYAWCADNP
ncbi:phosphoribosylformylglycinamidine synthase [Patescibacteria group bacterium]|nr:phosphoribosylformylglycinamidine synthase [Patescibacteria group bacterium]